MINENNKEKPTYYGILPAAVRYNEQVSDFGKVLFADITALSNKNGYCNASNSYFADAFGKSDKTISRTINRMHDLGLIRVIIDKDGGNERKIYPSDQYTLLTKKSIPIDKNVHRGIDKNEDTPIDKNVQTPIDKNVYHNNTSNNNTRENTTSKARERANVVDLSRLIDLLEIQLGSNYFDSLSLREKKLEQMYAHSIFKKICGRIGQDENEPQDLEAVYEAYQDFMTGLSRLEWWKDKMTTAGMIDRKFTDIAQKLIKSNGKAHDDYALAKQIADELQAEGGW